MAKVFRFAGRGFHRSYSKTVDPTGSQQASCRPDRIEPETRMTRTVHCAKLDTDAEGLDFAPWPGELGKRIYEHISKQAWQQWLAHQTMLINENRINPLDPKARKFLEEQMRAFLFGDGELEKPEGYVPPEHD